MEAQMHRTHYDTGHKDEAETVNESHVVRSGLVEPTVMGTPVLAEDLYTTHSDIVDPPMRTFEQWEEEERRGVPPPLSTGVYGTHPADLSQFGHQAYGQDEHTRGSNDKTTGMEEMHSDQPPLSSAIYGIVGYHAYGQEGNKEQSRGIIGKSTGMEEDPNAPNMTSPGNHQSKVTDPTNTGGKEAGITDVLKSFHKMSVVDNPDTKSSKSDQNEPGEEYTGSHDQFAPEPVEQNPPLDTIAEKPSNPKSSYNQKIASATSAKDTIVSKLNPVYEKVVGTGSSVMAKMHGSGHADNTGSPKGGTVREYLVDAFKPGDDDKVLSEAITNVFHRGKGNAPSPQETTTTTSTTMAYVIRDEGERTLQDSGN